MTTHNNSFSALMFMKGNSVRVKNKNIIDLNGKPLFSYVLNLLQRSNWISEIIINTDSELIADMILLQCPNAVIHWREESILGDDITANYIIEKDLKIAKNNLILQTHATNPLLSLDTLNRAKEIYLKNFFKHDSLLSVNMRQSRCYDSNFLPLNHEKHNLVKSQDLKPIYEENSLFYFFSKESFQQTNNRVGKTPYFMVTPKLESFDIDTEEDLALVRKIMATE